MAFQALSIGDILMLSQQAWKIGRAFTQGRGSALSEFTEVEREANGLSEALKLTAETLHADGSILSRAEPETRGAVNEILESAAKTLSDLESFVERYQVIRKKETSGGWVVGRSWSEVMLANYKTIKWTTEGGDITELRDMLHMHTNTINLTMQALQSKSLSRLERVVVPMAENVASLHSRVNGDLGDKIDVIHQVIMSLASNSPSLVAHDRSIEQRNNPGNDHTNDGSTRVHADEQLETRTRRVPPGYPVTLSPTRQQDRQPHDSVQSTPSSIAHRSSKAGSSSGKDPSPLVGNVRRTNSEYGTGSPPELRRSTGATFEESRFPSASGMPLAVSSNLQRSNRPPSGAPRRESTTLPALLGAVSLGDTSAGSSTAAAYQGNRTRSYDDSTSPVSPSRLKSYQLATDRPIVSPPATPSSPTQEQTETTATPSSFLDSPHRSRARTEDGHRVRPQTTTSPSGDSPASPSALATLPAFEKSLFRNAAILCDVRGKLVEYAQKVPDEPDPRYDTEMVEACEECRVCVIRKRENRAHGGTKLTTSIWAISVDGTIRCQQKLSDYVETVPYCSYFEQEKVSIPPTEDVEMILSFHGEKWTDEMEREVKTNWVNYVFVSENDAIAFQSAVFGRMLVGSFRTTKTTVIHEGLKGTFAFEEQFANIEMLRLWEDDGVATPGGQGGVLALMHVSSNFGEGWARWWMNCSTSKLKIRDDPPKNARLKGMDVIVVKPGTVLTAADRRGSRSTTAELQRVDTGNTATRAKSSGRKIPCKRVTGIRIEFKTEEEKDTFLEMSRQVQDRMIPLPDL